MYNVRHLSITAWGTGPFCSFSCNCSLVQCRDLVMFWLTTAVQTKSKLSLQIKYIEIDMCITQMIVTCMGCFSESRIPAPTHRMPCLLILNLKCTHLNSYSDPLPTGLRPLSDYLLWTALPS